MNVAADQAVFIRLVVKEAGASAAARVQQVQPFLRRNPQLGGAVLENIPANVIGQACRIGGVVAVGLKASRMRVKMVQSAFCSNPYGSRVVLKKGRNGVRCQSRTRLLAGVVNGGFSAFQIDDEEPPGSRFLSTNGSGGRRAPA